MRLMSMSGERLIPRIKKKRDIGRRRRIITKTIEGTIYLSIALGGLWGICATLGAVFELLGVA